MGLNRNRIVLINLVRVLYQNIFIEKNTVIGTHNLWSTFKSNIRYLQQIYSTNRS